MHTHVGYTPFVGHSHGGSVSAYTQLKPGKNHALILSTSRTYYVGLCGAQVHVRDRNEFGEPIRPNVTTVTDPECLKVKCKRCLKLMAKQQERTT